MMEDLKEESWKALGFFFCFFFFFPALALAETGNFAPLGKGAGGNCGDHSLFHFYLYVLSMPHKV